MNQYTNVIYLIPKKVVSLCRKLYVVPHAEKANAQIGTFGFCRPTIQTQKTKRAYFFTRAQTDRQ
jgi:hypothetical protein